MILLKVTYWIILFCLWVIVLKYRKNIYDWTGKFGWAERYIGSWWTVIVIILTWLLFIFLSVAYPMGLFDEYQVWNKAQINNSYLNNN